jgi:YegS/Rv2252/BmrU family lipid kinase
MKILVIVNLRAGRGKSAEHLETIRRKLKEGNELKVYVTQSKEQTICFVREKCRDFDMIIVVGGDGTLNEVLNGYLACACGVPLGYIPAGSTNDFANTLKLESDPEKACDIFLRMNTRRLDVGCLNGTYYSYVAAAGAFSATSYNTPAKLKNKIGHMAYILGGLTSIPTIKPQHMRITIDGEVYEDDYLIVAVSNSTSVGGVFTYEDAMVTLDDGMFEVALLKSPDQLNEIGSVLKEVFSHEYAGDYFTVISGSHVTIESPKPVSWSIDGEYGGEYYVTEIENHHGALNLLV